MGRSEPPVSDVSKLVLARVQSILYQNQKSITPGFVKKWILHKCCHCNYWVFVSITVQNLNDFVTPCLTGHFTIWLLFCSCLSFLHIMNFKAKLSMIKYLFSNLFISCICKFILKNLLTHCGWNNFLWKKKVYLPLELCSVGDKWICVNKDLKNM